MDENKFSNQDENWLTDRKKLSVESHFGPQTKKFYWLILTHAIIHAIVIIILMILYCCQLLSFSLLMFNISNRMTCNSTKILVVSH